jgi:hypothetical protein
VTIRDAAQPTFLRSLSVGEFQARDEGTRYVNIPARSRHERAQGLGGSYQATVATGTLA